MTKEFFPALHPPGDPKAPSLDQLFAACPPAFKDTTNAWNKVASQMRFYRGAETDEWKFRVWDSWDTYGSWLVFLTTVIEPENEEALPKIKAAAAWVLYSMLQEPPEFVRAKPTGTVRAAR